jgi:hypothetical protein
MLITCQERAGADPSRSGLQLPESRLEVGYIHTESMSLVDHGAHRATCLVLVHARVGDCTQRSAEAHAQPHDGNHQPRRQAGHEETGAVSKTGSLRGQSLLEGLDERKDAGKDDAVLVAPTV